jgi:hypothetical protein
LARETTTEGFRPIFAAWWPLAGSWILMATELPMLSAVVARLADPKIHLAAYGSVVFPLALIVEGPVIMLLAASTALVRDRSSYVALRRFVHRLAGSLTLLHVLLAFTPLFDLVIVRLMEVPAAVVEPARLGLMIMTPWTWTIASRRFNQGILIRYGLSRAVGVGTTLRLGSNLSVLGIGYLAQDIPGIVVAASAIATGVTAEALYAAWRVRPLVRRELAEDDPRHETLRGRAFLEFYVPLAMTPLITLSLGPFVTAAMSRMPEALASLAVWPVVHGLLFLFQSVGLAYNEVVVSRMDRVGERPALRSFALMLSGITSVLLLLISTPLIARVWFGGFSGLSPELVELAATVVVFGIPIPAMRAIQSWYHGALVHTRHTRGITESVVVFVIVCGAVLAYGIQAERWRGLDVAVVAFALARVIETIYVGWRARSALRHAT